MLNLCSWGTGCLVLLGNMSHWKFRLLLFLVLFLSKSYYCTNETDVNEFFII